MSIELHWLEVYAEMHLPEFASLFRVPGGHAGQRTNRHLDRFMARKKAERAIDIAQRKGSPEGLAKIASATMEYHRRMDVIRRFYGIQNEGLVLFALDDDGDGGIFRRVRAWDDTGFEGSRRLGRFEAFELAIYVPRHGPQWFIGSYLDVNFPKIDGKPMPSNEVWPAYSSDISALLHEQKPEQFVKLDAALREFANRCDALAKGDVPPLDLAAAHRLFIR